MREYRDEQLDFGHLAGCTVNEVRLLSGVIDEQLVASEVVLPHHEPATLLERAVAVAEGGVLISGGVLLEVLQVEQLERHARSRALAMDPGTVRLRPRKRPVAPALRIQLRGKLVLPKRFDIDVAVQAGIAGTWHVASR